MCELNLVVIGMGLTVALLRNKRIISKCLSDDSVEFFREFS